MIQLTDVSHYFPQKNRFILQNISWHIKDGENWVLFGRNGSGKTKLLEIISGYLFPSKGAVVRFGKKGGNCDIRELRKMIGYSSSYVRDKISNTEKVVDVIMSGLYASIGLYEKPAKTAFDKAGMLLETVGMRNRENDNFGNLSDGEKQKILLLRALIHDPRLLILDEPANGLDFPSREDFLETMQAIVQNRKVSIVYVTHHTEEITPLFKKIFMLDSSGTTFFQGDMEEGLNMEKIGVLFDRKINIHCIAGRYVTLPQ